MSDIEQIEYLEWIREEDPDEYNLDKVAHDKMYKEILKKVNKKPTKKNCRANNGKNEKENITKLIFHLNNNTELGIKIIKKLKEEFGIIFNKAISREGNRKSHYDFIIIDNNGKKYQVEHKGSCIFKRIATEDKPWKSGVQFLNGGAEKFSIAKIYARIWYDEYIRSNFLSTKYNIESPIPTFNTWFHSDCCKQGDPGTSFGKELKNKFRNEYGRTSLLDLRKKINSLFLEKYNDDKTLQDEFKNEINNIVKQVLEEKHLWIQINGDLNSEEVSFKWYGSMSYNKITEVSVDCKTDINFTIQTDKFKFSSILRWGKGTGFSNLRIDAK